jgi:hypothetical protein
MRDAGSTDGDRPRLKVDGYEAVPFGCGDHPQGEALTSQGMNARHGPVPEPRQQLGPGLGLRPLEAGRGQSRARQLPDSVVLRRVMVP